MAFLDRLQTVWHKVDGKDMPKDYVRIEDLVNRLDEKKADTARDVDAVHDEWAATPYTPPPAASMHHEVLQKSQNDMNFIFYVRSVQRFFDLVEYAGENIRLAVVIFVDHDALSSA